MRLAYSGVTPAEIEEGVSRLAQAYEAVIGESRGLMPPVAAANCAAERPPPPH